MDEIEKIAGPLGVLAVHTIAVYVCAVHLSPWLVGRVFYWILPLLGVHPSIAATDWYLQHLEIVTIVPALLLGLIAGYLLKTMSKLAWVLPTSVLLFEMLKYAMSASALASTPVWEYFFKIQNTMPNRMNWQTTDPVRVLMQMIVTTTFYAGLAYSFGSFLLEQMHKKQRAKINTLNEP